MAAKRATVAQPRGGGKAIGRGDWKAQIKQVIDEPAGPGGRNVLLGTVEEFVAMLNEPRWLHAELERGSTPSLRSVVLAPRTRRNERNVILSLWITPYSVSVVGEQGKEFEDPAALQRFFVDFAKRSELAETIEEYRRICLLPVKGVLRTTHSVPYAREDVAVVLDPSEPDRLAEAVDRVEPEVLTVKAVLERVSPFDERVEYRFLDAAGLGLSLTEKPRLAEDGVLHLTGTPFLMSRGAPPLRLIANAGKCWVGSAPFGAGFILSPEESEGLVRTDPKSSEVLAPYLTGYDVNARPDQAPDRLIINFRDWPLSRARVDAGGEGPVAADYPAALGWVEARVKPARLASKGSIARAPWWQFWRWRKPLYDAIGELSRVLVCARVSKHHALVFVEPRMVFSEQVAVFALDDWPSFAALQSFAHEAWLVQHASRIRDDARYVPADCFETFPLPLSSTPLATVGELYHERRKAIMLARGEGLTRIYNCVHDRRDGAGDVQSLRDLQVEMDRAVAVAYGWGDLDLAHGFHSTEEGLRFTIVQAVRDETLARLSELNHQRYAEEVAEGLHEQAMRASQKSAKSTPKSVGL